LLDSAVPVSRFSLASQYLSLLPAVSSAAASELSLTAWRIRLNCFFRPKPLIRKEAFSFLPTFPVVEVDFFFFLFSTFFSFPHSCFFFYSLSESLRFFLWALAWRMFRFKTLSPVFIPMLFVFHPSSRDLPRSGCRGWDGTAFYSYTTRRFFFAPHDPDLTPSRNVSAFYFYARAAR